MSNSRRMLRASPPDSSAALSNHTVAATQPIHTPTPRQGRQAPSPFRPTSRNILGRPGPTRNRDRMRCSRTAAPSRALSWPCRSRSRAS
jgi:hypothetical protein